MLVDVLGSCAIAWRQRDTYAGAYAYRMGLEFNRRCHACNDAIAYVGDQVAINDAREYDCEFISPQAGDKIAFAQGGAQAAGGNNEQVIARVVAERVVDALEAVEID